MGDPVTISIRHLARGLGLSLIQVQTVLELLDEGNTVPFITRYRKDQTGGLDEEQIRQVQSRLAKMRLLAERKQTILRSIESQGKLTESLAKSIHGANTTRRLEDLYLPFKPKKQTLASLARDRGLEPLANEILRQSPSCADLDARAADFIDSDKGVPTAAEALLGAGHILAERFSENVELRQHLRDILQRTGIVSCLKVGSEEKPAETKAATAGTKSAPVEKVPAKKEPSAAADQDASAKPSGESSVPADKTDQQGAEQDQQGSGQGGGPEEPNDTPNRPTDPNGAAENDPPAESPPTDTGGQTDEPSPVDAVPVDVVPVDVVPVDAVPVDAVPVDAVPVDAVPVDAVPVDVVPVDVVPVAEVNAAEPTTPTEGAAEQVSQAAPPQQAANAQAVPSAKSAPRQRPRKPKSKPPRGDRRADRKKQEKKKADERKQKAFRDYFDFNEAVRKIPPHRVLAINRGERARMLRVRVNSDTEALHKELDELCVPEGHAHSEFLRGCARDALVRLTLPSLEREVRRELTDRAETHAVSVFAKNLRNLLLQPPIHGKRVLAVDPGFKSGCKLVALDQFGNILAQDVIYLIGRAERKQAARRIVQELITRYQLVAIAIGNGTACRETEDFFSELISGELKELGLAYVIVNEAGASVYSASPLGREEFPNYDASVRGAISIGRRLQDPLSELVKIDPASIGVGLYQHDVKAKHLRDSLDAVVESCVNYVGVDVNTASPALLRYVSGLNQLTARRIHEHRREQGPFRNLDQLKEVAGFGETTFLQSAGFLKVAKGDNPLDATWIHPESYATATRVLEQLGCTPGDLSGADGPRDLAERIAKVDVKKLAEELQVGELTLKDILAQLARPGRDPREDLPPPIFRQGVLKLEDLEPGMHLTGTVLNVVDFGAFIDVGMHDSGLVHVSQLADRFVRNPHDVIAVGDVVKVWVVEVDKSRRRVSLTMIAPGTQRAVRPKDSQQEGHARPKQGERTRTSGRPRGRDGQRPHGGRPPKYKPKSRPKPVTPITKKMKSGDEPMRTFGDLAQFFRPPKEENTVQGTPPAKPKKKPKGKKAKPASEPGPAEAASQAPPETPAQPSVPTPAEASDSKPGPAESAPSPPSQDDSHTEDRPENSASTETPDRPDADSST